MMGAESIDRTWEKSLRIVWEKAQGFIQRIPEGEVTDVFRDGGPGSSLWWVADGDAAARGSSGLRVPRP